MAFLCINFLENSKFSDHTFTFRHGYVKLQERYRKETGDDDYYARNGRILHSRRSSPNPQHERGFSNQTPETQQIARIQNRRNLESEQNRTSRTLSQVAEYPKARRRQKIKPAGCWQRTIEDLVADTFPVTDCNPRTGKVSVTLPTFSIASQTMICQCFDLSASSETMLKFGYVFRKNVLMDNQYSLHDPIWLFQGFNQDSVKATFIKYNKKSVTIVVHSSDGNDKRCNVAIDKISPRSNGGVQ